MNSSKVLVSLAVVLSLSLLWTACGGGGSTPPPPPGAPTIQTAELPQGAVNTQYLNQNMQGVVLSATGGTGAYTWSIAAGSLPPGLSLNAQSGVISGTPTTLGNYAFTAKVTDAANLSSTANLSIYIVGVVVVSSTCGKGQAPNFCPPGAPMVGYTNQDGSYVQLSASGGQAPYKWSVTNGALPAGLILDPASCNNSSGTCLIIGVPTTDGTPTTFTIQAADSETPPGGTPPTGSSMFTLTIISITTTSLPPGYIGVPYTNPDGSTVQMTVGGGSTPYSWGASNLPPGLALDPACAGTKLQTCAIKGTPTQTGSSVVAVMVKDGEKVNPASAATNLAISIYQSQIILSGTLPPGTQGVPYKSSLSATGGVPPYNWSISMGTLPPGLSLDPATCTNSSVPCIVSGTPSTPGPYIFTILVKDSEPQPQPVSEQQSVLITFSPLTITTSTLPAGLVGVPYNATLMAAGGFKPYNWCIVEADGITCDNGAGILPAGLTLNQSTGVISGNPTATGTSSFKVQVQDSGSPQQTVRSSSPLSIAITSLDNSTLNGNYVFTFSGYNNGTPVMMAGSFVADGKGNITSGVLDYNNGAGESPDNNPTPQTITAGPGSVYNITPSGLGTMTITTNLTTFQFAIVVRSDGNGRLIQSDPANPQQYGSGAIMTNTLLQQGQQWPLCNAYVAVGLSGFDQTLVTRYAAAGQFHFDATTCVDVENGVMDTDDGGTLSPTTFTGAFNQLNTGTGRGIAGFTLSPGGRHFFAFYLVSSSDYKTNKLFVVATEAASQPANLTLWSGLQQTSSAQFGANNWNNLALSGTGVAELNALDTNGAVDVTAGLFVGKGAQANNCQNNSYDAATFTYDENQGGACNGGACNQPQSSTGTYCIDKSTGRVTLTNFTGQFGQTPPVFYMVGASQAFVVGTDAAVTSGNLESQSGSPFSNSSVFGLYAGGTISPVTAMVTNDVSSLFADGNGNMNGTDDTSGAGGPAGPLNFSYTYGVDSTGRTLVCASGTCNAQSNNIIGVAYVISPTKFVLLPVLNSDGTPDQFPALSVFGE